MALPLPDIQYVSPHDPALWVEFKVLLRELLTAWPRADGSDSGPLVFQCDNRARGVLGDDLALNAAALLWANYIRAHCLRTGGLYLHFSTAAGALRELLIGPPP